MSKKIIFIGPASAGKTTLRKIFFEGESCKKLIKHSLEPTHGQDSIILDLQEKIGIFDLAGQENDSWLDGESNAVFIGAALIIVVVDSSVDFDVNLDFIKRVISVRDELSPDSIIYVLNHKIDLIDTQQLYDLRYLAEDRLYYQKNCKIAYTSIKSDYFASTFSLFIDILNTCIYTEIAKPKEDLEFMKNTIFFLYFINESNVISQEELQYKLNLPEIKFKEIDKLLLSRKLIRLNQVGSSPLYHLTDKGKSYMSWLFRNFCLHELNKDNIQSMIEENKEITERYNVLGFFMANKNGVPILKCEIEEGFFDQFLKNGEDSLDTDLIPMFISALEMFSSQINIKDLSGIKFKGSNVNVQTYSFGIVTVSLFFNSKTDIKSLKEHIYGYFEDLIQENIDKIEKTIKLGDLSDLYEVEKQGSKWLQEINKKYADLVNSNEIFDVDATHSLYEALDTINQGNISGEQLEVVRKLKLELIKSSIQDDVKSLKDLSQRIKEFSL